MKIVGWLLAICTSISAVKAFAPTVRINGFTSTSKSTFGLPKEIIQRQESTILRLADLDTVGLVAGQETYGFGVVVLGEAIYSFLQAPSFDHAKVLVPGILGALICGFVAGPMVTSGDASSVALGLEIATATSILMGASYVARMVAPYSPSPKEIAFLGLLVAAAGFFSFSQNLIVDGFVTLPSIPLPSLPSIEFPSF